MLLDMAAPLALAILEICYQKWQKQLRIRIYLLALSYQVIGILKDESILWLKQIF